MSDLDHIYFNQEMKENDATQFLKAVHKEFLDLLSKGIFELIPQIIVPEIERESPPEVWAMKRKRQVGKRGSISIRLN